jgi:hypothetical protein
MKFGKYKNLEFRIWDEDGIWFWRWSHYGAQTISLAECYIGIRRAASDWSKIDGEWGFLNTEL